jgi:hypothetical protein
MLRSDSERGQAEGGASYVGGPAPICRVDGVSRTPGSSQQSLPFLQDGVALPLT